MADCDRCLEYKDKYAELEDEYKDFKGKLMRTH